MAKYDVYISTCISPTNNSEYCMLESHKYFILKHGEDIDEAQLAIQRYLNKCGCKDLIISTMSVALEGYNTSDIPQSLITTMNGIYNEWKFSQK